MRLNEARRVGAVTWPVVIGALILASCGGESSTAATASTIDLDTAVTNYIVKEPVTTTVPPVIEDDDSAGPQEYVVQAGDYPIKVAQQFGVPLDALINFNGWASAAEFPGPNQPIKIPPGGTNVAPEIADPEIAAGDGTTPAGETIPEAGDNCGEGKHTVVSGDYPLAVSKQYDVTIESLDAANGGNPAYGQFVPGQTIIIPAKADC